MQLYAGLDVHAQFTYGTIVDEMGNPLRELQVPTSAEGYAHLFGPLKDRHRIKMVFEASRNWLHIATLLRVHSQDIVMAHPLKVRAIASARIKTDKIDSKTLADLLRANLIPQSYMPPADIMHLRELLRYRVRLGRMAAHHKTRIRSILAREGKQCAWTDPTCAKARLWLSHLELQSHNRREMDYLNTILASHKEELKELDALIHAEADKRPEVGLLSSIPGFAEYSSLLILAEMGDYKRFETAAQLAAYAGLVSSTYQSSSTRYQGRITKQGNKWLRWILVECCHITIRKPNRIQRFYLRLKKKKGHQKAIVATARKTLTLMWNMLQKQQQFQP